MIVTILLAIGFMFVLEGLVYALAPSFMEELLRAISGMTDRQKRQIGALVAAIGLLIVLFAFTLSDLLS